MATEPNREADSPRTDPEAGRQDDPSRVLRLLLAANALLGALVLVVFAADVGYDLPDSASAATHTLVQLILAAAVVFEVVQVVRLGLREYWLHRKIELLVAVFAMLDLAFGARFYYVLSGGGVLAGGRVALVAMLGRQVIVIALLGMNALRVSRRWSERAIPPSWLIIISFAALILLGTFLLVLPNATTQGELGWLDALFTATSAVTVTGLTVVDTGSDLSTLGQLIVLGLLQIGGIGVMTLTYFVAVVLRQDLTLRDRLLIREMISEQRLAMAARAVVWIVITTLLLEAIGAGLLMLSLADHPDRVHALYTSIFHSVSAFCNAGFSIYDESLADELVVNRVGFQITMMVLIILGGLGFPVLRSLGEWFWNGWFGPVEVDKDFSFSTHAKLVFSSTALLLLLGTAAVYFSEYLIAHGEVAGSGGMSAAFLSVTARTAGFNTVDTGGLATTTALVLILLMAIGGAPAGTAGGMRTTTVSIALLNMRRTLHAADHLRAFGVRIPDDLAGRALAVISLSLAWIGTTTWLMAMLHPEHAVLDLNFEVVSAFSTVGLSRGITPTLGPWAKGLLILTMFAGRIGILAFINAFIPGRPQPKEDDPPVAILL